MQSNTTLSNPEKLLVQNQERREMNDARNMDNNRTSELFINQSVPSLNKFEVDPQDDILILFDKENGDAAGTDKEVDILSNILYKGKNGKA